MDKMINLLLRAIRKRTKADLEGRVFNKIKKRFENDKDNLTRGELNVIGEYLGKDIKWAYTRANLYFNRARRTNQNNKTLRKRPALLRGVFQMIARARRDIELRREIGSYYDFVDNMPYYKMLEEFDKLRKRAYFELECPDTFVLREKLEKAVQKENYEEAGRIKARIDEKREKI
jgi:hypothetical protein